MRTKLILLSIAVFSNFLYLNAQTNEAFTNTQDGKTYQIKNISAQVGNDANVTNKGVKSRWAYMVTENNVTKYGLLNGIEAKSETNSTEWHSPTGAELHMIEEDMGLSTIKATGKEKRSTYDKVYRTINSSTAGTLSTLLTSDELNTVTDLVVIGTIDVRDFVTLNNMPMLNVLDIKDVNIAKYNGPGGTGSWSFYWENEIPYIAFADNHHIASITIPSSATSFDYWAFSNFSGNINADVSSQSFSSIDGVLYDKAKTKLFRCPISKTGTLTLPSTVTYIGHAALLQCEDLTSIILPESLDTIDRYALGDLGGLTSLNLPASLKFMDDEVFFGPLSYPITVDTANQYFSALDGVLFDKNKTILMYCPTIKSGQYIIPSTVTTIHSAAFSGCKNLTDVPIPSTVTSIGKEAFQLCSNLVGTLTIPESITKVENFTFWACGYTLLILPNTIDSIGIWAFLGLPIRSLTIPSSVTYLGDAAFGSGGLYTIYVNSANPINIDLYDEDVFVAVDKTYTTLYVPYGTKSLYRNANYWSDFTNIIEMPANPVLKVSATTLNIPQKIPRTATFKLTLNLECTITTDQPWLTIRSTDFGLGSTGLGFGGPLMAIDSITLTAIAGGSNASMTTRTANIFVSGNIIIPISVTQEYGTNGINETDNEIVSIYPNPANTILAISNIGRNATVSVYDIHGLLVVTKPVINNQLDINELASGFYILQINNNNKTITRKLIKQ